MVFNIIFLSLQLVTSGAMVPRELLSGFYHDLGLYLPGTYAASGCMNLMFGGPRVFSQVSALLIIALVSLIVGSIAFYCGTKKGPSLKRTGPRRSLQPDTEKGHN